jgi:hypothetical protein
MSTQFKPLEIPPGVVSKPTKTMRSSNWAEVNNVRWREGKMMPIGGQAKLTNVVAGVERYIFASKCRDIHGWTALSGLYCTAYLCEQNIYVDVGGSLYDITPLDGMAAPTGLLGGYGDGAYGVGPYSVASILPSVVAEHRIPDAYSLDNMGAILYAMTSADSRLLYWNPDVGLPGAGIPGFAASLAATAAFTTASPNITMTANTGFVFPGMSVYNTTNNKLVGTVLTYVGTALVLTANALVASAGAADVLTFGNYAQVQPANAGRGPVPNGRCFVVTQERFIMIFGSTQDGTVGGGSPHRMAWCDQENPGAWDYSNVVSQAGFLDVEPASPIICAIETRAGVLFWTATNVYGSAFLGIPYVYNYVQLGAGSTPWSTQSVAVTSSLTFWFSEQGLFSFDGTTVMPVACEVRPWIDSDIDVVNVREWAFAVNLAEFNELWWFFPQTHSTTNTRAMIYNYKEGLFSQANMSRSAAFTSSYTSNAIFADDFVAIQHEVGSAYYNESQPVQMPWVESFNLNLAGDGKLITVKQLIPDLNAFDSDMDLDWSFLSYSLFYRISRSTGIPELQSPLVQVRPDGYVDLRTTGRDIRLRIDMTTPLVDSFTMGQHLIDFTVRGDR